jgi:hypothetical protein
MIYLIIIFNALRFIGLEISPPGFYADESLGATQVICLWQTSADLAGKHLPQFSTAGTLVYTPTYLYGQLFWTSIFGHSIAAFRGYSALITTLTVFFLFLYVKNLTNLKTALYVAFIASIMPWAFQFSRIAWDPPLGPFFLILGMWSSTLKRGWWITAIPLALSIYSYPPLRIVTPLLWILLPSISLKRKLLTLAGIACICIPLALQYQEEGFKYRSNMLTIWSTAFYNPYRHFSITELIQVFGKNWIAHFSPSFLFFKGEGNLRHSVQTFGMLSWLDAISFFGLLVLLILRILSKRYKRLFFHFHPKIVYVSMLGICISAIPAALTNELSPNALRSISSWPFYAILSGYILYFLGEIISKKIIYSFTIIFGSLFFLAYQYDYFYKYPIIAKEAFEAGYSNEILYPKIVSGEATCNDLRNKIEKMDRNTRIGELINFSKFGHGPITSYLNSHWHDREDWGIWSDGKNADILIPIPHGSPKRILLELDALISPRHPEQVLEIWIKNEFYKKVLLTKALNNKVEVNIENLLNNPKQLNIEFRTPKAISPAEAGLSLSDKRILGIGLRSLMFEN